MQLCIFRPQTNVQEGQEQHTGGHRSPTALFVFPQILAGKHVILQEDNLSIIHGWKKKADE